MKPLAGRPVLLAICALAAIVQIASVIDATGIGGRAPWRGSLGADAGPASKPFTLVVTSADRSGPADLAGLRRDDLIDLRAITLAERYSLLDWPLVGRPIVLLIHRGSLQKQITVIPQAARLTWNFWLGVFATLWLLLFAALIAWRGADIPQMRLLSLWLAVFVLTGALLGFATPWAWAYVLQNVALSLAAPVAVALLAAFASGFAQPLSPVRRIMQWLCYALLAIFATISLVGITGVATLRFDPVPFVEGSIVLFPITAAILMAVLCGFLAIAASRGVERQRAVWTLVPLAAFFCFFIVSVIAGSSSSSYAGSIVIGVISTLVLIAAPVALTYAALSRRLIDVGFFLNRAAVFTGVSAIVIGVFVLVEWSASVWLVGATHTTSVAIGMIVALVLGLSLRYIHKYVDRFVDRVLFHKRHEDEAALRRFAHEASYIADRSTLLERAVQTVQEHTTAGDAMILLRRDPASYAPATDGQHAEISQDDPGVVALRAWNKPIDLHEVQGSALHGEFAFPILSRGELIGALICGPKRDGDVYAPDELEALLMLAYGLGAALAAESANSIDLIAKELAALRKEIKRDRELMLRELRENAKQ